MIDTPRTGCAFHGALQTLSAIPGVVPVAHSTANCAAFCSLRGQVSGNVTSVTNVLERHVIFGGAARLREQLKNTARVRNGGLYAVVAGCAPEIVGDDSAAMTKELTDQGYPAICVSAPGFGGGLGEGYEKAVDVLLKAALLDDGGNESKSIQETSIQETSIQETGAYDYDVNILGIVPFKHIYWLGELYAIHDLTRLLGLRANLLLGPEAEAAHWRSAKRTRFSLVFSQYGLRAARFLEANHGIPYLLTAGLPTGARDSELLAEQIRQKWGVEIPESAARQFQIMKKRFRQELADAAPYYYAKGMQREFAIVAGHDEIPGCVRMLTEFLGMVPSVMVVTDIPESSLLSPFLEEIQGMAKTYGARLLFSENTGEIHSLLMDARPGLILGSGLEAMTAKKIGAPLIELSAPVFSAAPVFARHYCGLSGGESLMRDIFRAFD
jgi:nitrogenase molybdenum-iron protein beta chain